MAGLLSFGTVVVEERTCPGCRKPWFPSLDELHRGQCAKCAAQTRKAVTCRVNHVFPAALIVGAMGVVLGANRRLVGTAVSV